MAADSSNESLEPIDCKENQIELALAAYRSHAVPSLNQAAKLFGIPPSTLKHRNNGRRTAKEFQQAQQRLSIQEESAIQSCILQMACWGYPIGIKYLEGLASDLLKKRGDNSPLGHNWYKNYLVRHPMIKSKLAHAHDQSRMDAINQETLQQWFSLYNEVVIKYGILAEDQYNMDEKGFMKGTTGNSKVLVPVQDEKAWVIQPGDRDWVSVIETIGMSGYSPPPFVIFAGKQIQHSWIPADIDPYTVIRISPAGWTDRAIALSWLNHFNSYTQPRTKGTHRLLILDGHTSHTSLDFIQFCENNKIIPLCLPPHATHELQPLDVGIFSPLALAYKQQIRDNSIFGAERISNSQFLIFFQRARQKAITSKNIAKAWQRAGLLPYDPAAVLQRNRPRTPPFISLTDENGIRLDIKADEDQSKTINELVAQVLQGVSSPHHSTITTLQNITLTAIADRSALQYLNSKLVQKQKQGRQNRTKKNFGEARELTVAAAQYKIDEKAIQEQALLSAKERAAALRGKVGFAKLVWKHFKMDIDVFSI